MDAIIGLNFMRTELFWRKMYAIFLFFLETEMAQGVETFMEGKGAFLSHDTVKPVYNDHRMGYYSASWSSFRWPRAT